ncbi:hypothetical protein BC829DRAFT_437519 [Chytridium lagenaria]|nr:hypothetical protein BC829DRAFT_437519 [Chytridium lagenaria]
MEAKKQTPASTVAAKNIAVVPAVNPEDTQKKVKAKQRPKTRLEEKTGFGHGGSSELVAINNVDEVANMIEKTLPRPPDCSPGAASAMKNIPPLPAATLAMEDQESPAAAPTMENNLDSPSAAPNVEDKATFPDALNTRQIKITLFPEFHRESNDNLKAQSASH